MGNLPANLHLKPIKVKTKKTQPNEKVFFNKKKGFFNKQKVFFKQKNC